VWFLIVGHSISALCWLNDAYLFHMQYTDTSFYSKLQQVYVNCLFQIRRPYFHVKPLEKAQLKNWRSYLEFEIANGSEKRVTVLFERCVIACALYEEFWMKVCL